MNKKFSRNSAITAFALIILSTAKVVAAPVDEAIVYIECLDTDGKVISQGSGTVVSEQGHVLSARHVFYQKERRAAACRGKVGAADSNTASILVFPDRPDNGLDAIVAQFSSPGEFAPMKFCNFADDSLRMPVFISGFPVGTKSFKPSFRAGVVSTTFVDPKGRVETDAHSARGMSGGPVVSEDGSEIVGIVTGAEFDTLGLVTTYSMTPVSAFAGLFAELETTGKSCLARTKAIENEAEARLSRLEDSVLAGRNPFRIISELQFSHFFRVLCTNEQGVRSSGSGFIVSDEGHLVTADFVVGTNDREIAVECQAMLPTGQKFPVIKRKIAGGAALMQLHPPAWTEISANLNAKGFRFRSISDLDLGDDIATIGYPNNTLSPTLRRGFLATNFPDIEGHVEAVVDVAPGMSGAPVFGRDATVIGLVVGVEVDASTGFVTSVTILSSNSLASEFSGYIRLID